MLKYEGVLSFVFSKIKTTIAKELYLITYVICYNVHTTCHVRTYVIL